MICFDLLLICCVFVVVSAAPQKNSRNVQNLCDCECGAINRQMRVVGGNVTKVHEFPWIAGLSKGGKFLCGATLITRRHVLTAAHCVNGLRTRDLSIVLADYDRRAADRFSNIIVRGLRKVREHEGFDVASFNNDIAVLELDQAVDFNVNVQPACLPSSKLEDLTGRTAIVAGWGKVNEHENITSNILRKVAVPIWTKEECYSSGYGKRKISENMFCAGYPEGARDACQGDSGGPLQMSTENGHMELVGVVSWGRGCARPNLPGVYTKIENYLDWVEDTIDGECLCPPAKRK